MQAIAKRLCEAWLGAVLQRVSPEARIWSPRPRRVDEPDPITGTPSCLLLQCSWAEYRQHGPSTRISRRQVYSYLDAISAGVSASKVRFVLVDMPETDIGSAALYTISLQDLLQLVNQRGRGTVDARTLRTLLKQPSFAGQGYMIEPLERTLEMRMLRSLGSRSRPASLSENWFGMGLHNPSPLAIGIP
jgi:hypothetical protein